MITNFLLMAEAESSTGSGNNGTTIVMWIVIAALVVFMIIQGILSRKKQKKQLEEMESRLVVGATITTIGGIVGKVTRIDEETGSLFIETGDFGSVHTLQIIKNAVGVVHADKNADEYEEVTNEIK